jgi:hypothetical protein
MARDLELATNIDVGLANKIMYREYFLITMGIFLAIVVFSICSDLYYSHYYLRKTI